MLCGYARVFILREKCPTADSRAVPDPVPRTCRAHHQAGVPERAAEPHAVLGRTVSKAPALLPERLPGQGTRVRDREQRATTATTGEGEGRAI